MRTVVVGVVVAACGAVLLRRRQAARAEQALWDEAARAPRVVRDLR